MGKLYVHPQAEQEVNFLEEIFAGQGEVWGRRLKKVVNFLREKVQLLR